MLNKEQFLKQGLKKLKMTDNLQSHLSLLTNTHSQYVAVDDMALSGSV
jgi:hypothetical protein